MIVKLSNLGLFGIDLSNLLKLFKHDMPVFWVFMNVYSSINPGIVSHENSEEADRIG